mmetsp:Transcript_28064/g.65924  ORF Transcript_28064/g.65924 Transcript_28064/m.65924 type:complete len:388 (-) Transcript_28064:208-1371(-)
MHVIDLLVFLLDSFCDSLTFCIFAPPLALHINLFVLGPEGVQLTLEVQVSLLLRIVLHQAILRLFLLVEDGTAALLGLPCCLFLDDFPPHHRLERPFRTFLLFQRQSLHQPLLSFHLLGLLPFEIFTPLMLDLLIGLNAVVDFHVTSILAIPQKLPEGFLLLRHKIDSSLILCPHLVFPSLQVPILLLTFLRLLSFYLPLALGISHLSFVGFLEPFRIFLLLVLQLELLLVKLFFGKLFLQLLPGFHFHLLSFLHLCSLVIHLLHLAGLLSYLVESILGFGGESLVRGLKLLELMQFAVQGALQPTPFCLLSSKQLLAFKLQGVAVQCEDCALREPTFLGDKRQLLVAALFLPVLVGHNGITRSPSCREEIAPLGFKEVEAKLLQPR